MALWAMTPRRIRALVIPAHRADAASLTEDAPLTAEEMDSYSTTYYK